MICFYTYTYKPIICSTGNCDCIDFSFKPQRFPQPNPSKVWNLHFHSYNFDLITSYIKTVMNSFLFIFWMFCSLVKKALKSSLKKDKRLLTGIFCHLVYPRKF